MCSATRLCVCAIYLIEVDVDTLELEVGSTVVAIYKSDKYAIIDS